MSKTKITFDYEGKGYTLEFTADSLKKMEKNGFNFFDVDKRILSVPEELFEGAFIANHPETPKTIREEIYNALTNTCEDGTALNEALSTMLSEAIDSITNRSGNIKWKMVN